LRGEDLGGKRPKDRSDFVLDVKLEGKGGVGTKVVAFSEGVHVPIGVGAHLNASGGGAKKGHNGENGKVDAAHASGRIR
jgi:hypothetical protein